MQSLYAYTCARVHTHTLWIYLYIYTHTYIYIYTYTQRNIHTRTHIYICVYVCICMYYVYIERGGKEREACINSKTTRVHSFIAENSNTQFHVYLVSSSIYSYCLSMVISGYYYLCNFRFFCSVCLSDCLSLCLPSVIFLQWCVLCDWDAAEECVPWCCVLWRRAPWVLGCRLSTHELCSVIENAISNALLLSYQVLPAVSSALISIGKDLHRVRCLIICS